MREIKNADALLAMPLWLVLRSAKGVVYERDNQGYWHEMGSEHSVAFNEDDFPANLLWTYADELIDPEEAQKVEAIKQFAEMIQKAQQQQPQVNPTGGQPGVEQAPGTETTSEVTAPFQPTDTNGEVTAPPFNITRFPDGGFGINGKHYRAPESAEEEAAIYGNPNYAHLLPHMEKHDA